MFWLYVRLSGCFFLPRLAVRFVYVCLKNFTVTVEACSLYRCVAFVRVSQAVDPTGDEVASFGLFRGRIFGVYNCMQTYMYALNSDMRLITGKYSIHEF